MGGELRKIEISDYERVNLPSSLGRPPELKWISIADLVIDTAYQREITRQGRTHVRAIAAAFCWSKFKVPVVAAAGSGKFAIVDGQHRITAAALAGLEREPCAVITASQAEQASAFSAINGAVTRMHQLQIFRAACVAGDRNALKVRAVAQKAGVTIVGTPTQTNRLPRGSTMAVMTIERAIEKFGAAITELALRMVMESGQGEPLTLCRPVIYGTAEVLADHREWVERGELLRIAFGAINILRLLDKARVAAAGLRGSSIIEQFEGLLVETLDAHMKKGRK